MEDCLKCGNATIPEQLKEGLCVECKPSINEPLEKNQENHTKSVLSTTTLISPLQRLVYVSAGLALFSMFLPWAVLGAMKGTGWELDYFFCLIFWAIPCFYVYKNNRIELYSKISICLGVVALVAFLPGRELDFLGKSYSSNVGAGAYIYSIAWAVGLYGHFLFKLPQSPSLVKHKIGGFSSPGSNIEGSERVGKSNELLFLQVSEEYENGEIDKALWAKATVLCKGDEEAAKFEYIRLRVEKLEQI